MLEQALRKYQNRAIETAKVIEELIQLARDMRKASERGEQLGLTEDEVAFYDAPRDERQCGEGARRREFAAHRS
jgi:type I restriction enzyme, R subunit